MGLIWIALGGPHPAEGGGALWGQIVMMAAVFAIFYLILIAPMRKKQRQLQSLVANIKSGDKVVTNGGMLGTVVAVTDRHVQLRVADKVKIHLLKSAIAGLQDAESPAEE
ncbi:MAG TPA: preprotein translocase subunit YajC [Acidobacteriota bacterium]